MATKSFRADPFESLRQTVSPSRPAPGTMDWTAEQLRNSNPRTTAPISERVSSTLRDADRYLKTGQISAPTPEGSTFVKGGKVQPKVAAPQAPTTLLGKAKTNLAPGNLLRNTGRAAGPLGAIGAAVEDGISATGKAADGDYQGAAVDAGRGVTKGAGAWAGGVAGAKLGAAAGLGVSAVAPIAAPIALPVLTGLGGIGGAIAGQEGAEKAYDWASEKLGLRDAQAPAPTVAPANSGINPQGLTSPGRTLVDDPRRVDMDPGRASLGAMRDFSRELGAVPDQLPSGLRQGVVVRTLDANGRPVYSGSNVRENPQFVDGLGRDVSTQGSMNVVQGMNPSLRTAMAGSGGPVARVEPGVQGGGMVIIGPTQEERDLANRRRSAEFYADSRDRRTRERGLRELDALDRAALAQRANETSLRIAIAQADAARYGADRRLEGDMLQAEATTQAASLRGRQASMAAQMERQAQTLAMQLANGDRRAAARILDSMGFSGAKLLSSEASEQGLQIKNREDSEALLKSLSVGEGNKIDAGLLARNQAVANDITGGRWSTMTPTERAKRQDDVRRGIQLLEGLNQYRDSTWAKRVGWDDTVEEFSSLPDVKGATITRLGAVEGAGTARAGKGDWKIRTQKGEVLYVPSSAVDQATLDMLKEMGAKIDTKD